MNHPNQAFIFLINVVAGWLNRRQQRIIDFMLDRGASFLEAVSYLEKRVKPAE